jgi:hypothetical protein
MHTRGEYDEVSMRARYHGHRTHRGEFCLQCFHCRSVSEDAEACEAYECWLTYRTTKRVVCEQYVSR